MLSVWPEATASAESFEPVLRFNEELQEAGVWVFAAVLGPRSHTRVVHTSGGVRVIDGPYAEAKELIGGFCIIDVNDLDEALEWARKGSTASKMPVEVRPLHDPTS